MAKCIWEKRYDKIMHFSKKIIHFQNHRGFFLFELIIYLVILSLLILIGFKYAVSSSLSLLKSSQSYDSKVSIFSALDLCRNDIQAAHKYAEDWYVISQNKIIFKKGGNSSVGWHMKGTKLMRTEGTFSAHKKKWLQSNSCMAAKNILIDFQPLIDEKNKKIIGITVACTDIEKNFFANEFISPRNGKYQ